MLNVPAPFPHVGSQGFLRGTGERVRILRRNADSTAMVELLPAPGTLRNRNASGNREVAIDELAETQMDALTPAGKRGRGKARR